LSEGLEVREGSCFKDLKPPVRPVFCARGMMIIDEVASCAVDHPYGVRERLIDVQNVAAD
jgi:hypothetical protein